MNLLTSQELADLLKLSARHISERMSKQPDFPSHYKIGHSKRWDEDEIKEWIEKQKTNQAA